MPVKLTHTMSVSTDGELPHTFWLVLSQYVKLFAGKRVQITIGSPKRSNKANSFYWAAVITPIWAAGLEAGMTHDSDFWHEHFKKRYLKKRTVEVYGKPVVLDGSTAELDSTTFSDYIQSIRMDEDVIKMGVYIAEPGELTSYSIAEPQT